jgi:bud site selection protein 20
MGQCQRRRKNLSKNKQFQKIRKTKRRVKDIDEIINDLKPENIIKLQNQKLDEDLPGLGQFYCVFCARYFINGSSLNTHYKSKEHKKQIKRSNEPVYTIHDSKKYGGQEG